MSQQPPVANEPEQEQAPPEPRFWKRYSAHHEFPLSSVGSVVFHVLLIGVLVVVGYIITQTRNDERSGPPIISVVAANGLPPMNAGGGGQPDGGESDKGGPKSKSRIDSGNDEPPPPQTGNTKAEPIQQLEQVDLQPLQIVSNPDGTQQIVGENKKVFGDVNDVVQK